MNMYGLDSSLFEFGFNDPSLIDSISSSHTMISDRRYHEREEENLLRLSNSILRDIKRPSSPPKHRHDGTSPLPLGMDWSPPPRNWSGVNTIWPHDFHTGWSYCVTVPSWSIFSESSGSEPVVFYRVQVGLQSPEGTTTTREVLRRFSDFLKLSSDLKQSFRNKKLPPAPPKGLLRMKNRTLLEERRCFLEDWMARLLSDIDVSRSAPVACFLELEAAARSSFRESSQNDIFVASGTSARASNNCSGTTSETSESRSDLYVKDNYSESHEQNTVLENNSESPEPATANEAISENNDVTISKEFSDGKVKDLETELESSKQIGKETLEQALFIERERFTQLQWDMQELGREFMEMEFRLKAEQDEKVHADEEKASIINENEALRLELDSAREQLKNLQKYRKEADLQSKSNVKLLVKEVKSLRSSQSELKQEYDAVSKESVELKTKLQKERTKRDCIDAANRKLLHECNILRSQLEECGVNFLVEQEYKLKMESPGDAMDLLATSENRIGLLLAEAQLLAREVATPVSSSSHESDKLTTDDELRKMLTEVLIDNAILRKQATSIIRCALDTTETSPQNTQMS
ncbi:PX domain-containing protein EREX-like [Salvia splendens]|uniref:PX domain-containing protein EREX-like n=1 Tax=Salvia splendens TaxID=180675 RepID=UPI001C27C083|nr:PX domain-containing protein EREX-like [Salvia splendens]XP_042052599.1 PX domain-containing protein EREX-like [Salvia splendens]XP_042052600.1 PX domain-containing protein EREX-like [Salvia splendens]